MKYINLLSFVFIVSFSLVNAQPKSLDELDSQSFNARVNPFSKPCIPIEPTGQKFPEAKIFNGVDLDGEWQLIEGDNTDQPLTGAWEKSIRANVPGSIHTALWEAGVIPDPYFGRNDSIAEKCSYKTWWYKKEFGIDHEFIRPWLVFEGVAVKCSVWLNGILLGDHEGMFGGPSFDISKVLKKKNILIVKVYPAPQVIEKDENIGWKNSVLINCVYGWHYSKIPSLGIWRSVRIADNASVGFDSPPFIVTKTIRGEMNLHVPLRSVSSAIKGKLHLMVEPKNFEGEPQSFVYAVNSEKKRDTLNFSFQIKNPHLWWPNDLGNPDLYRLSVLFLPNDNSKPAYYETAFGIRTITMAPLPGGPLAEKYNWTFVINGKPHFVKGNGWCTNDVLLDFSRTRYERFLSLARLQHVQMMRAWGCGMPETDDFYDLCDQYGIMIMQEWPTAWNSHVIQPYDILEETVRLNTLRLRNHPSLVMYGGGNESDKPYGKAIDMMGKYSIELDNSRPFHRGEPWGGSKHNYDCWWGKKALDNNLTMEADFWGEFGIASLPEKESVIRYLPKEEKNVWPLGTNSAFAHHTPVFNRRYDIGRLSQYSGYVMPGDSLDHFIIGSQLAQVVAVRHTLERARTRWPDCSGALYYKMNDNYPAASWSCVDWYGAPKALHYFAQDAFSPVAAVVLFEHTDMAGQSASLPVFLLDDNLDLGKAKWKVIVRAFNNKLQTIKKAEFTGQGNETMVKKLGVFSLSAEETQTCPLLVVSEVLKNNAIVFRTFYFMNFEKEKGNIYQLPKTELTAKPVGNKVIVTNTGKYPAVGVTVQLPGKADQLTVSDGFFWLDSGEEKTVNINLSGNLVVKAWNTPNK